jgi:dynamin 1/3
MNINSCCLHLVLSNGKDTMARRPADPEEELRWMSQEVRGYVEAVLNSLAANVPKVQ